MIDDRENLRIWSVKDEADAKYQVQRRIEKEGYYGSLAYLVDDDAKLPVDEWITEYEAQQAKYRAQDIEASEKQEYERLRKKFAKPTGGESDL